MTPRSIPNGLACNNNPDAEFGGPVEVHGGQRVVAGENISFTYSLMIKHSDKTWADRMDHYMNYGQDSVGWFAFTLAAIFTAIMSFCVWCILASILNKDYRILGVLRQTYRERIGQIRRRVRSVAYG